jgi:DNA topoisomerase-1
VKASAAIESDSDDAPLISRTNGKVAKKPPRASDAQIGDSSDSDAPLGKKLAIQKQKIERAAEKEAVDIRKDVKKHAPSSASRVAAVKRKIKKEESSDDDVPLAKKASSKAKKAKTETVTPPKEAKGKAVKKEESADAEDGEEEYRWWEDPTKGDGTNKWETLEHAGVVFPPEYEPLPKNVKMKYDGKPISMHPDAEEVAGFFGAMLNSTHNVENPTFQKNFFGDFKDILKQTGGAKDSTGETVPIKEFSKCDFTPIFNYYDAQREAKKALGSAEKKAAKAAKDEAEAPFMYCTWDGRKQKVGNFRVEPPGLFRGRGDHPKTGKVKTRVKPEQVTINIGKEATVPPPPQGHKWKLVKHDKEGTWLAMWQENVNGNYKYVMLAANSDVKGQSDFKNIERTSRTNSPLNDKRLLLCT